MTILILLTLISYTKNIKLNHKYLEEKKCTILMELKYQCKKINLRRKIIMKKKKCRDPDLNYKDLWISIKYCRNPVKDILAIFKNVTHEGEK